MIALLLFTATHPSTAAAWSQHFSAFDSNLASKFKSKAMAEALPLKWTNSENRYATNGLPFKFATGCIQCEEHGKQEYTAALWNFSDGKWSDTWNTQIHRTAEDKTAPCAIRVSTFLSLPCSFSLTEELGSASGLWSVKAGPDGYWSRPRDSKVRDFVYLWFMIFQGLHS